MKILNIEDKCSSDTYFDLCQLEPGAQFNMRFANLNFWKV